MKRLKKTLQQHNEGSAMIVAIVVSAVVMVFVLSLLLLSYSLFSSVIFKTKKMQFKELAYSISKELEKELTVEFENHDKQRESQDAGDYNLWFYVRYNIWQGDAWPYYNEDENNHRARNAHRYFKLNVDNEEFNSNAGKVLVTMYWDCNYDTYRIKEVEDTILHVIVEVSEGDNYYSNEMTFALVEGKYEDTDEQLVESDGRNDIIVNDKWTWRKE